MKRKQLLLLLALLITAATGAWAQQVLRVKPITEEMATLWTEDGGSTLLTPDHLPGFCPATEDEAKQWADVPQEGTAILIYDIDDPDDPEASTSVRSVWFYNGHYSHSVSQTECTIYSLAVPILGQGVKFFYTWAPTYTVKLADGTKDADNWTIAPAKATDPEFGVAKGKPVTLSYSGRLKVKSVTATFEPDPLATPLTMECLTDGTIVVNMTAELKTGMKYSVNGGDKVTIQTTTTIDGLKAGDKVQFYGNGTKTQYYGFFPEVSIQGSGDGFQTKVYGNIMSLLDETGFATMTDLPDDSYVFYGLFLRNTTLIDASELLLPAKTLADCCYRQMFEGCTNLTTAPKLPAATLAFGCYKQMFQGCTSLIKAPKLPATTLQESCYMQMFYDCTSLTSAYVKAAYTVENDECRDMFDGCSASGAVLHTTSVNKESWEAKMGAGNTWPTWSVADDWQD